MDQNRPKGCGTARGYWAGCRCGECRAAIAAYMRSYAKRRKERTGQSMWARGVRPSRPKAEPVHCADCGALLKSGLGPGADPAHPRCRPCGQYWRRGRLSDFERKWRDLDRKLTKAAQGSPANPRWPFVAGRCAECDETFIRRGKPSGFCSSACRRRRRARERAGWISLADRLAIYERDGWVCQLCFEPVDRDAHHNDMKAPTLDHIECRSWALIPDHSPANLRLACRRCNSLRGDETWLDRAA